MQKILHFKWNKVADCIKRTSVFFVKMDHSRPRFLHFCIFNTVNKYMPDVKVSWWLDSNLGPLASEWPLYQLSHNHCLKRTGINPYFVVNRHRNVKNFDFAWRERKSRSTTPSARTRHATSCSSRGSWTSCQTTSWACHGTNAIKHAFASTDGAVKFLTASLINLELHKFVFC